MNKLARILIIRLSFHNENVRLDREGVIPILAILITGMLYPTIPRLLIAYSIRIDWKEVWSLLW